MAKLLSVEALTILGESRDGAQRYSAPSRLAVDGISFDLAQGGSVALVGDRDSGTGDVALAVLRARRIASGTIFWEGAPVSGWSRRRFRPLRRKVQAVFPDAWGQLPPVWTVDEIFQETLATWHPRESQEERRDRLSAVMVECGLPEMLRRLRPVDLDRVERQKVAVARALVADPALLVCHQVTAGCDAPARGELWQLLAGLREERGLALLVTTSDLATAYHLGDVIGVMHRGRMLEYGPNREVLEHPSHDYTQRLVSCAH